jgi:MFS family permease
MLLAVVLDPVRRHFAISDLEVSVLQGPAFLILYSVAMIPIGRLVDSRRRVLLISLGILVWSVSTSLAGICDSYWQLFLTRIGVGVGEAVLVPAAFSLIPDTFPRSRLGLATGVFGTGGALGLGSSLFIGGSVYGYFEERGAILRPWGGVIEPWQQTFLVIGAPGILLAILFFCLPEPHRRKAPGIDTAPKSTLAYARREISWLTTLMIASGFASATLYTAVTWISVFLTRKHGWPIAAAAMTAGLIQIGASIIGTAGVGIISDFIARRGSHRRLMICSIALAIAAITGALFPLAPTASSALVLWGATVMLSSVPISVASSNFQEQVHTDHRGILSAVYVFVMSTFAFIISTVAVAYISEVLLGGDSIHLALSAVIAFSGSVSAILYAVTAFIQRGRQQLRRSNEQENGY